MMGSGFQVAEKWLPSLVICYKVNEKPKIEFMFDVCDCRKGCTDHADTGSHECAESWQRGCLDVPLIADPGSGPLPRLPSIQCGPNDAVRVFLKVTLPPSLFCQRIKIECSPPGNTGPGIDSTLALRTGGSDPLLCRYRC